MTRDEAAYLWDEICLAVIAREYEQRLAEENLQINRAFTDNLVAIENARHRRQN
jgi:hypothetical protein